MIRDANGAERGMSTPETAIHPTLYAAFSKVWDDAYRFGRLQATRDRIWRWQLLLVGCSFAAFCLGYLGGRIHP